MSSLPQAEWLNLLIGLLQSAQLALLHGLDALGLVGSVHGQPAWPWGQRLSGENLLIDLPQARHLALTLALLAVALVILVAAIFWRRPRFYFLAMLPLVLVAAPWPDAHVVLVPATPASFHTSTTGFTAASIGRGQALYAQHCVACHGADGRGQGQQASALPVWPPNLTGPLLWRRADGDVLWHILHGMRDRHRVLTMPGFEPRLGVDDAWALIDFMKAQAAGETLRASGVWAQPIGLPDVTVRCEGQPARALASWRGQRVRVVADGAVAGPVFEDPRFVTVLLRPGVAPAAHASAACVADGPEAWAAFALVAGTGQLAGTQLLSDRDGWLRARGQPGKSSWSDEDLLCRSSDVPRATAGPVPADGLAALIAVMDAEPVRFVKGGFAH